MCYVDVYNEVGDNINIVEVKATTTKKYYDLKSNHKKGEKFSIFEKKSNVMYLKDELDSIRIINDIKIDDNLDLIVSRVKYRNVYEYSDTLTIFKGFKNNVFKGDVVLNNDGLIGVISKSYEYYSVVTLLTNKDTNISVKINDAVGVLKCVDGKLVVSDINNYGVLEENDLVYTSGLGNLPANIYIGKVKSVSLNNTEIEKVILVDINDRLEKLDYVFVRGNHD